MRLLFTYITTMAFLFTQVAYGDAVIFSGNDVKTLKPNIQLFNQAKIMSGTVDPSSSATSANTGSLYLNTSNGNTYRKLDSGSSTNWSVVGSSGSSGINYVTNPDIESSATGYATYADAAAATPVDGTGGTPNVTATRTTNASEVQRGAGSLKFSKDAADRQGQGFSFDIKLSAQDKDVSKAIIVSFEYKTSAAYVNEDVQLFAYDKDGATLLGPLFNDEQGKLLACPQGGCRVTGVFYSVAGNDDYRVIAHVASTNASAYDIFADTFRAGPDVTVPGAIITEWQSYTPTGTWSANTTYTGKWRRIGDSMQVQVKVSVSGAPTATDLSVGLPSGYTIDTNKIGSTSAFEGSFGPVTIYDATNRIYVGGSFYGTNNTVRIAQTESGNSGVVNATNPFTFGSGDSVSVNFIVPISGWASSAALSTTEAMLSTVKAQYYISASTSNPSVADAATEILDFDTKVVDTHSAVTTGAAWKFTAPKNGWYDVTASTAWNSLSNITESYLQINKNGSLWRILKASNVTTDINLKGSDKIYLLKGDFIDIRAYQNDSTSAARTVTQQQTYSVVSISEIPDFSTFSVYGNFELLSATSSTKTPTASGNYAQMTGNSLTLTPGTWRLYGSANFTTSGGSATYALGGIEYFAANGADTSTGPADISTVSGLTVLTTRASGAGQLSSYGVMGSGGDPRVANPTIVRCTSSCTVYLVPYATMSTPANARITVYPNAERLQ